MMKNVMAELNTTLNTTISKTIPVFKILKLLKKLEMKLGNKKRI